jgi:hypothetical protein
MFQMSIETYQLAEVVSFSCHIKDGFASIMAKREGKNWRYS